MQENIQTTYFVTTVDEPKQLSKLNALMLPDEEVKKFLNLGPIKYSVSVHTANSEVPQHQKKSNDKEGAKLKSSNPLLQVYTPAPPRFNPFSIPPPTLLHGASQSSDQVPLLPDDEAKIRIWLVDGKKLEHTFKAKEPLSTVRLYIKKNRPPTDVSPIKLMTTFPKKVFTEEDYEKPLDMLGLCPSAIIRISH